MNNLPPPKHFTPDYKGFIGDMRLERRAKELFNRLSQSPGSSIQRLAGNRAEQKAYYRFLNNERVKENHLIKETSSRMVSLAKGRHLLCIQDTSEIALGSHKGRVNLNRGLGRSDNSETAHCFKLHPSLVLDAEDLTPLGFSDIKIFHRPLEKISRHQRKYYNQPIEEKESYKWIEAAEKSKIVLQEAESVTFIEDREGDIYEQFALIPDEKTHLLIRSRATRKLINGGSLYNEVDAEPVAGVYKIELPTDKRKSQYKREAIIELRFKTCSIQCPKKPNKKGYPKSITISCISVKEMGNVSEPINWKLITTHNVVNYQQALTLVSWYSARWYIEQIFRLLKRQGFGIEETELESGWAIRKLVVLQLSALLKILQMNIAYAQPEGGQPIEEVFDQQQIEVLKMMNDKLQGKTIKLQNNHNPTRVKWATWVVGRLGGWKGYDSQGPPGVITLIRGMDRLGYLIEGVNLMKDVGTP